MLIGSTTRPQRTVFPRESVTAEREPHWIPLTGNRDGILPHSISLLQVAVSPIIIQIYSTGRGAVCPEKFGEEPQRHVRCVVSNDVDGLHSRHSHR